MLGRRTRPARHLVFLLGALLAGCSSTTEADNASSSSPESTGAEAASTTEPDCTPQPLGAATDLPSDPTDASLAISRLVFACADTVIVSSSSTDALASGARMAAERTLPLLVTSIGRERDIAAELSRLNPSDVVFVAAAGETVAAPPGSSSVEPDPVTRPALALIEDLGTSPLSSSPPTWVTDSADTPAALAALPAILAGHGRVLIINAGSVNPGPIDPAEGSVAVIGDFGPTARWQLLAPLTAPELPGGGVRLFPGRRILAFFGSPVTFRLGLLGEQGPDATFDRILPLVEQYQMEGGDDVLPGFELVATVADAKPGEDGDYSKELRPDQLRPWIEVAAARGAFVILDLQPGRTDFLTQARRYEELLRLPNVGLALDPEWRLGSDEVHLRQIGTVDAAEVNDVVEWLAELVRDENLPQKLLVLHQFELDMITNREAIRTPPELAVVLHVDGQGPLGSKYGTFDNMFNAPVGATQQLWWGWKNFIDEDDPTASPGQVNAVEPLPVVITYQ